MSHELNLAKRPFLNPRPVLRVTILLWALGVAVMAFNVRLYFTHYSGSGETLERQQELGDSLRRERQRVEELEAELARIDLTHQNEQSAFLNAKIAERSFSWSTLFDRLGEVMPDDMRLTSLSPSFGSETRRGRSDTRENEVLLAIRGIAKSSEVVLEFIDSLFSHESFRVPNILSEKLQDSGLTDFSLDVIYEPRRAVVDPEPAVDEDGEKGETSAANTEAPVAAEADRAEPASEGSSG